MVLVGECGRANQKSSRIVGGSQVSPNEFPWMTFLRIYFWNGDAATCGGTLIDSRWILTAAHCLYGAVNVSVTLGAHDVTAESSDLYQQNFMSQKWTAHPLWRFGDVENDIALIQLPQAAMISGMTYKVRSWKLWMGLKFKFYWTI